MAVKPFTTPYKVSLSISHPEMEPHFLTEKLELTPSVAERKGERLKRFPLLMGTQFWERLNKKSLWVHDFRSLSEEPLDSCLLRLIAKLRADAALLNWIRTTGGGTSVKVYLHPTSGRERLFDYVRIDELRKLGVDIAMEYFPNEDYVKPSSRG